MTPTDSTDRTTAKRHTAHDGGTVDRTTHEGHGVDAMSHVEARQVASTPAPLTLAYGGSVEAEIAAGMAHLVHAYLPPFTKSEMRWAGTAYANLGRNSHD